MLFKNHEHDRDREHERSLFTAELCRLRDELSHTQQQLVREISNVDWLRVRVNQLEMERASLLMKVTGTFVSTPTITREFGSGASNSIPGGPASLLDLAGLGIVGQNYDDPNDK